MRIRLAKKIWKRPWRYSPGKLRVAAYRLSLGYAFDQVVAMWEKSVWGRPQFETTINPLGITYWITKVQEGPNES
jgi:hypothetical protein